MSDQLEYCSLCSEPTGHAGAGEDSIFIETNSYTIGPLCDACTHGIREWVKDDIGHQRVLAEKDKEIADAKEVENGLREDLNVTSKEATEYHSLFRDGFRFTEDYPGEERVAYYWCGPGGPPPSGWSVRDGLVKQLRSDLAAANKRIEEYEGVLSQFRRVSIAACEAFAEGVETGEPRREDVEALLDASGHIKQVMRKAGLWPIGKKPGTTKREHLAPQGKGVLCDRCGEFENDDKVAWNEADELLCPRCYPIREAELDKEDAALAKPASERESQ